MGFKERLRQARKAREISGEYLGTQVGVSKQTISHWEHGRYEPSIEQIKGLCNALRVTPNWLFEAEADLPPDALEEARVYARLTPDERARWRTVRQAMFAIPIQA